MKSLSDMRLKRIFAVMALLLCFTLLLAGCSMSDFSNKVGNVSQNLVDNSTSTIQGYLDGEEAPDIKFDTTSAGEMVGQQGPSGGNYYYDEKSGEYVSSAQYRANHFVDSLKVIWVPVCVISFFFGFMIRRLNHSSATIRKFGFFLEVIVPVVLTVLVYIFCALADSSIMDVFDGIF